MSFYIFFFMHNCLAAFKKLNVECFIDSISACGNSVVSFFM